MPPVAKSLPPLGVPSQSIAGWAAGAKAGLAFASLYLIPVQKHDLPRDVRLEPVY